MDKREEEHCLLLLRHWCGKAAVVKPASVDSQRVMTRSAATSCIFPQILSSSFDRQPMQSSNLLHVGIEIVPNTQVSAGLLLQEAVIVQSQPPVEPRWA